MDCLNYPFENEYILRRKLSIKRELLAADCIRLKKKIAILGGSTTDEIKNILELFLLNYEIEPVFFQSEYAQFWNDAMFSSELEVFEPDLIFIHTGTRNVAQFPNITDSNTQIDDLFTSALQTYQTMWETLSSKFACPIIQNNFERPIFRILGNKDITDIHGRTTFVQRLNNAFYQYAREHDNFYINDVDYISADFGIGKYSNALYWNMYKYSMCLQAIPSFAYNLANIIKSIFGKNKKAMVLDLDNTLWGGVIAEDGIEGIAIGPEMPMGQAYSEFQNYIKLHKDLGVLLCICSKNDEDNAFLGLNHPDSKLKSDDFVVIKSNWQSKDINVSEIAKELNIGFDSLVFIDDNPAEREIVKEQLQVVSTPDIAKIENYIYRLDRCGFFETTTISADDLKRGEMYMQNAKRAAIQSTFKNYNDYLLSLNMTAEIKAFNSLYLPRIAQLTNKSNQFNLTTRRYTQSELEEISANNNYITLFGKLSDKFGDNGVVSVIIGKIDGKIINIDLWLMSCRVLKREMELAMLDAFVNVCKSQGITTLIGRYYPTAKNSMVKNFYSEIGFEEISASDSETQYILKIEQYINKCLTIKTLED